MTERDLKESRDLMGPGEWRVCGVYPARQHIVPFRNNRFDIVDILIECHNGICGFGFDGIYFPANKLHMSVDFARSQCGDWVVIGRS